MADADNAEGAAEQSARSAERHDARKYPPISQWVFELPPDPPPLEPAQRRALEARLFRMWFGGRRPPAGRRPRVAAFVGAAGSGKSTYAASWAADVGAGFADVDEVARLAPAYAGLRELRDVRGRPTGVGNAHAEIQSVGQIAGALGVVLSRAAAAGLDIVTQATVLDLQFFPDWRERGYDIDVLWVATPPKVAAARYWARAQETGRHYVADRAAAGDFAERTQSANLELAPSYALLADRLFVVSGDGEVWTVPVRHAPEPAAAATVAAALEAAGYPTPKGALARKPPGARRVKFASSAKEARAARTPRRRKKLERGSGASGAPADA